MEWQPTAEMTDTQSIRRIKKTDFGFESQELMAWDAWSSDGLYLGQYQINCMDDGPSSLFFRASEGDAKRFALSEQEMAAAS